MKYAVFLSLVLVVSLVPSIIAPPYFSEQDKYNAAHVIVTGNITSVSKPDPPSHMLTSTNTVYEVKVDRYIKNPLDQDVLFVVARGGPDAEDDPMGSTVNFDVGDYVYLYLREDGDMYRVNTVTSYKIKMPCEPIPEELASLTDKPSAWEFQAVDSDYNEKHVFAVGEKVIIRYDATNSEPETSTVTYDMAVHDGKRKDERTVFYADSKDITLPSCVGHAILEWSFTPTFARDYFVDVRSSGGHGIGFGISVTDGGEKPANHDDTPVLAPILKQFKADSDNLRCHKAGTTLAFKIDGTPACLRPSTLGKLLDRGWVAQYEPLPDMNLSGRPDPSEIAADAAIRFMESSPTMLFDGTKKNGGFANLAHTDDSPPTYLLKGHFTTDTTGYGTRENQEVQEIETDHKMIFKIKGSDVIYAVIDNRWDEINQEFIAQPSDGFKDFEMRYTKWTDGKEQNYYLKFDSRSGFFRVTEGDHDAFFLVPMKEFDVLWKTIMDNGFFEMETHPFEPTPGCNCTTHTLKIDSGGSHNTAYWYEGEQTKQIGSIMHQIDQIISSYDEEWPN